ncbi:MAG: DsbA family protein [Propionibacteriaceae bacterium]|nr:DsbA family protein [Propionibacteriaceae bacterium]
MTSSSQVRRSRRETLEAQRLATARKERRNKILFTSAGLLVFAAVIGVAIWGFMGTATDGGDATPPNAVSDHGIAVVPLKDSIPTLEIFADYNCNGCRSAHLTLNTLLEEYTEEGKINVVVVMLNFLDNSRQPAIASACSDFYDVFPQYHHELFTAAPDGFDSELLRETIPEKLGLTGVELLDFQTCIDTDATGAFVNSQSKYAGKKGVSSTPTFLLDGENIGEKIFNQNTGTYDPALLKAILDAQ